MSVLESTIERRACNWALDTFDASNVKIKDKKGWPDRLFFFKGQTLFVEFKAKGEKLRPLQQAVIGHLIDKGFTVWIIDDLEEFKVFFEGWVKQYA